MNWDAIGAIGEVVGAIAVVATLGYLALQVRQQNKEARLAANQELQRSIREQGDSIRDDPELVQIYLDSHHKKLGDFDAVSAMRLSLMYQSNLRIWEGAYYQHQADQLESKLWPPLERVMSNLVASRAFQDWWSSRRQAFSDEFVNYIDSLDAKLLGEFGESSTPSDNE